jgi:hypothetical protein
MPPFPDGRVNLNAADFESSTVVSLSAGTSGIRFPN